MENAAIEIFLDNYDNVCFPGQRISGRVECHLAEVKNIRAIQVKFEGKAYTDWNESERHYDDFFKEERTRDVRYTAEEVYFYQGLSLIGGSSEITLPPGRHEYLFSYIIPQQVPSSFEGDYGGVCYTIKATVDCPWRFDLEAKIILNLVSPLDLNYVPRVAEPYHISVDKTLCSCWCNDAGALTFNISLPITGYIPGQSVHIGAHVENMTNVSAEKVKFQILRTIEFIAEFPSRSTKYTHCVLAQCSEGGIGAHSEKSWTSVLIIPKGHLFPNMVSCNIINVTYDLQAEIIVPCPHTNLSTEIPLVIGHVPLPQASSIGILGPPQDRMHPPSYDNPTAPPPESPPTMQNSIPENLPYPPGTIGDAPYPTNATAPSTAGWSLNEMTKPADSGALPSYDEAQRLLNIAGEPKQK